MRKCGFLRAWLLLLSVCIATTILAQSKFTLNGVVRDQSSGELLIGAVIQLKELPGIGVTSNAYGFYSITVKQGTYTVIVRYSGYETITQAVAFTQNREQNFNLIPIANNLQEVVVSTKKKNENVASPLMGVDKLNLREVNELPVLLGEKDILKSIQLLPGIKSAGDGNSGFFVRGGGADQNLILLDEAPVYNATHLLGFFSTFNSDAIKDVAVYKGGMPALYGGRLSSVVDIKMKDGNDKAYHVDGGVGLISSRLTVEGPIVKNKGSFIISGRRTYADLFLKLSPDSAINSNTLYFYDLNLKANYTLNKKNHLYLSGYFGRDVLGFGETFGSDWGNTTGTLRWNHIVSNKLFSNTSLIFSNYNYVIRIKSGTDQFKITSKIQDLNLKQDFDYFINNNNKIKFGGNIIHHTVSPGVITATATSNLKSATIQNRYSYESAIYVSHELSFDDKWNIVYGVRLSNLSAVGPGNYYQYDSNGNTIDTLHVPKGHTVASYWNLEPRFSASYLLNTNTSLKFSYNRNVQNLHLLSNSTVGTPTDLWLPSTNNVKPEIADQVALGYYKNSKNQVYEFSVETYYKWLQNQIDYKNGADLQANDNVENELVYGVGRAYGVEFFAKKKMGKLTGWIGYTLSRTERKFASINNGQYFPARQDQTHAITTVGIYRLNQRWTLSANWVYNTGNAVTFPSGKYRVNNQTTFLYTERNGYRMPAYHRLDIAATVQNKKNPYRKYQSSLTFGVYNVYGRENPYFITFIDDPNNPNKTVAQQTSLFRFIPSITWNFKF